MVLLVLREVRLEQVEPHVQAVPGQALLPLRVRVVQVRVLRPALLQAVRLQLAHRARVVRPQLAQVRVPVAVAVVGAVAQASR
jgi:hypothetical protein